MRIALVSREYPPFYGGGIGAYTVAWSRALAMSGHQVAVITVSDDGTERRETAAGIQVIRLPFLNGHDWTAPHPAIATPEAAAAFRTFSPVSVFSMQIAKALPRLADELRLEVVEFPETGALGWFTLNARRTGSLWAHGGPAIVTVIHSPTEWIAHWNRAPLRGRAELDLAAMEEDCVLWSDGLACPSHAVAEWARERWGLPEGRIAVVPYPLGDLEPIARDAAGHATAARSARALLFVGRLEPRKGIDTLLEGFAAAVQGGANLTLDLAGEDMPDPAHPGRFGAARLARLPPAIRARIRAHGRLSPERVLTLQEAADIAVIPAPMDNFPYTCIEAMAHGRLAVAAAAGGMADMIRDGQEGLLFAPGDAGSCGAALARAAALEPAAATALRRAAARRILDLCGNAPVAAQRLEHYQRAASSVERRPAPAVGRWVVVNRGAATAEAVAALQRGAEMAAADFAHGWTRAPRGAVHAFSTPRPALLALAAAPLGPMVVAEHRAASPRIACLLRGRGPEATTDHPVALAIALLADGARGAVLPDLLTPAEAPGTPPAPDPAAELARIRASRGYRLLERVYDALHILRGRGLRRR